MADMPKNMVVVLRELSTAIGNYGATTPQWFQEMILKDHTTAWTTILSSAADELEGMQKLNGKLYKTLYPD